MNTDFKPSMNLLILHLLWGYAFVMENLPGKKEYCWRNAYIINVIFKFQYNAINVILKLLFKCFLKIV